MRPALRSTLAGLAGLAGLGLTACGDMTSAFSTSSTRFDGLSCETADDCAAPMACCLSGIATYGDSYDLATAAATAHPKCMPPNEFCDAYAPHLLEGQPCGRAGAAIDPVYGTVIYTGLDACRDALICCPSTLSCATPETCPAEPVGAAVAPDAGVGVAPTGDAGVAAGAGCSADIDCPDETLCCGISYTNRIGTCTSPRACGATRYAGGPAGDTDGGLPPPDADVPCTRPRGETPAACYGAPTVQGSPDLALMLSFEQGPAVCDASGQNHHGSISQGQLAPGQGVNGTGALDGTAILPIYDTMQPRTGLTLSLSVKRDVGGSILRAGNDIGLASNRCAELFAAVWLASVETPCGVLPAGVWTHVAVVADGTNLSVFIDGRFSVTAPGKPVADECGTLELGSDGFSLDEVSWWTRALTADEICALAGKGVVDGVCR